MKPSFIRSHLVMGVLMLLCLLGTLAVLKGLLPPQPRYQGKPLRFWVAELAHQLATRATQIQKAEIAVSAIGTNALPFILRELRTSGRPAKEVVLRGFGLFCRRQLHVSLPMLYTPLSDRQAGAKEALAVLGPALGVRLLAGLMNDSNENVCDGAAYALSRLPRGVVDSGYQFPSELALVAALSHSNLVSRLAAARRLRDCGLRTDAALPPLLRCCLEPDPQLREEAFLTFTSYYKSFYDRTEWRSWSEGVQLSTSLLPFLTHTDPIVREAAAASLGRCCDYGPKVIAALTQTRNDPDQNVSEAARRALNMLDAAKAAGERRLQQ